MNPRNGVILVQFINGIHIGRSSQVNVLSQSCCNYLLSCSAHDLLQTSIHDISLSGTFQQQSSVEFLTWDLGCLLDHVQQVVLGLLLPLSLHAAWSHVVQVLQPFEVAHSHSTSIAENIRQEIDAPVDQDLFSFKSSRPISSLNDQFGLEFVGIVDVDCLFKGSRDEKVALIINGGLIFERLGSRVSLHSFCLRSLLILVQINRVNSLFVVDASIELSHTDQFCSLIHKEPRSPVTHITKSLHHEGLTLESWLHSQLLSHLGTVEDLPGGIVDSKSSRFSSAADSSQVTGLASGHSISIDILLAVETLIERFHPVHFPLTCAHIGSRHVNGCSD